MTVKQTVEVTNKLGMHARPAIAFELMQGFDAEVLLRNDEGTEAEANSDHRSVNARLPPKGRQIEIEATTGPQEVEALAAVIALFNSGFDEGNLPSIPYFPNAVPVLMTVPKTGRVTPTLPLVRSPPPFSLKICTFRALYLCA